MNRSWTRSLERGVLVVAVGLLTVSAATPEGGGARGLDHATALATFERIETFRVGLGVRVRRRMSDWFRCWDVVRDRGFTNLTKPEGNRYVLLLTRSGAVASSGSDQENRLVREYSAWAKRERSWGHLIGGEKLNAASLELSRAQGREEVRTRDASLGGYFVIAARDIDAAVAIARTCPHLQHGGTVIIRPIDPTQ